MIIYKTTNLVNGKIYIGKDSKNDPEYLGSGLYLINAIKKYGKENFFKEILETCNSEIDLNEREKYWISIYNSKDRSVGYNLAEGGSGGNTRSGFTESELNEYKVKMSESIKNSVAYQMSVKLKTGITRPEHSKKMKELYASGKLIPHNLGVPTSEEVRKKISKKNKGRKLSEETKLKMSKSKMKAVEQYTLNGEYINTYDSMSAAELKTGIGRYGIQQCCLGRYKQSGGFIWKFKPREIV